MKLPIVILTLAAVTVFRPAVGRAQQDRRGVDAATIAVIEQTLVDVIARAEKSVVAVARRLPAGEAADPPLLIAPPTPDLFGDLRPTTTPNDELIATAAGVIIDRAGLVLTEYLAVREGDRHTVTTVDGTEYPATIRAADPRSGLAVLALKAGDEHSAGSLAAIPFGDAAQLRKGQFVVAIGNPYAIRSDGQPTASWGIVTNLARKAPAGTNLNDLPGPLADYRTTIHHLGTLIQTDAKLAWSAGGGALVNLRGELVGLTTTAATIAGHEQPAGYAIPIDDATHRIIKTLREGREVEYGLLGVTFRFQDSVLRAGVGAVAVAQVLPGSPAERAGLQPGDVITHVAGRPTADVDAIQLAISTRPPSQSVTIAIERGGQPIKVTATLAKLAVPGPRAATHP